jgi:hypothetical protein
MVPFKFFHACLVSNMGFDAQLGMRSIWTVVNREVWLLVEDIADAWRHVALGMHHFSLLLLGRRKLRRADCWSICAIILVGCLLGYMLASHVATCMSPSGLPGHSSRGSCILTTFRISFRARVVKSSAELACPPSPAPPSNPAELGSGHPSLSFCCAGHLVGLPSCSAEVALGPAGLMFC